MTSQLGPEERTAGDAMLSAVFSHWGVDYGPATGTFHRMPDEHGIVPCCGRHVDQIGRDWMTACTDDVTCTGPTL
ncbi:hypothetical protein Ade02nite_20570 [Paractinoplanes deccanensis]|uniref:Uncharacterized protein n=1 Tax=Paractinoplanes deccanensis TaxID=113561 RepID=A0ABQ3Y099_9ACTN|nr:hypothetical protein [Actinoplanes deccanensis]GID73416.1 hypothetical protein Ade02nite_20570 [Actinoplanes deccanensis]